MKINLSIAMEKLEMAMVFLAIFLASLFGAQVGGVSLNKIGLIPLEFYLLYKLLKNRGLTRLNKEQGLLLFYYFLIVVSSAWGLFNQNQLPGYETVLIFNIVQSLFMYIPILLGVNKLAAPKETFAKALLLTAQISCIWGIIQFLLWYAIAFDLNEFFFTTILNGALGTDWTNYQVASGIKTLRVSGLNSNGPMFGFVMLLGFCFAKNRPWKSLFFFASLISMSRSSVLTILFVFIWMNGKKIQIRLKTLSLKKLLARIIIAIVFVIVCTYLYTMVDYIQYQINYFIGRLAAIGDSDSAGTMRHMLYIPLAVIVWCVELPLISKLIGVGIRTAGSSFVFSEIAPNWIQFGTTMEVGVWAIECTVAEVLLGLGVIGFFLYYFLSFQIYRRSKNKNSLFESAIVGILLFGIMYNCSMNTIINLFFCFALSIDTSKEGNEIFSSKSISRRF